MVGCEFDGIVSKEILYILYFVNTTFNFKVMQNIFGLKNGKVTINKDDVVFIDFNKLSIHILVKIVIKLAQFNLFLM